MTDQRPELRPWGVVAMADSPISHQGLELPAWFDVAFSASEDAPTVAIRVRINPETGPVPVGVYMVLENPPTSTYRDAVAMLKGAPMEKLLRDAVFMAAGAWTWAAGRDEFNVAHDRALSAEQTRLLGDRVAEVRQKVSELPQPQRRRSTTPDLLRETAEVYRKAVAEGHPPTLAVSEHFTVSHRTAARWVSQARREGFLGPAQGTKAGEAPSTPSE
ncbi:DUF6214 family protein [Plantactinospora sp. WMMB334]|uniref:DUF6214 family protein n=1 Tax=Plantactinospora sp. WMMB334 TaxID=3404119 RepID=UPI003B923DDB